MRSGRDRTRWARRRQPMVRFGLGALVSLAALGAGCAAQAQGATPGQVAPPTLQPDRPPTAATPLTPSGPATPPTEGENLTVEVHEVIVENGRPELAPATAALIRPFEGRRATVGELYKLAGDLEAAYARAGFVLVRVVVPPQTLRDGATVRLTVVDGFIEAVDVRGPEDVAGPVRRRAQRLVGQRGLTLAQIERPLLLASALPGVEMRSTLTAGEQPGGARLILEVSQNGVSGGVSADNRLGEEYGSWELNGEVALNGVFGHAEQIYVSATARPDGDGFDAGAPRRVIGAGFSAPLGLDGLRFNAEATWVETNPRPAPLAPRVRGEFDRVALRLSYPILLRRTESLVVTGAFEGVDERQTAIDFASVLSLDKLRSLSVAFDWQRTTQDAQYAAGLTAEQGLDALGARNEADVLASGIPFSRQGATPDFSKLSGDARGDWAIGSGFSFSAAFRFQASLSGSLPGAEHFDISGPDGLSALALGAVTGDSGVAGRLRFARPIAAGDAWITPYVYGAAAVAWLDQPTAVEAARTNGFGYGLGVDLAGPVPGRDAEAFATLEFGKADLDGPVADEWRVTLMLGLRFR